MDSWLVNYREFVESKRVRLAAVQRKCAAAKRRLSGEAEQLGSLESRVQELEGLRKVHSEAYSYVMSKKLHKFMAVLCCWPALELRQMERYSTLAAQTRSCKGGAAHIG